MFKLFSGDKKTSSAKRSEERKHERIDFYQSSFFRTENGTEKTNECWFNNISMGGICFDTENSDLEVGESIKALYKIETKIRHDQCVIRFKSKALNNWRYGCEFTAADQQRSELIKRYIEIHVLNVH
ncbi:MAG: PilZ domain-containing protein [Spirochaetes bacterium]|nr:PilZ domain-containing protein [Spirochaetota bacterium]